MSDWNFHGNLSNFRIYNRALSAAEVTARYTDEKPGLNSALVAYYPFNGNAKDESGNGYEGTQKGGVTYVQDRFGKSSSACSFDGKDDYIHVDKPLELIDANECTVLAWFMDGGYVQIKGAAMGGSFLGMSISSHSIFWYANGNAGPLKTSPECPNCWQISSKVGLGNGWRHVAGTWKRKGDNIVVTLFINGEAVQSATSGLLLRPDASYTILGSTSFTNKYSRGILDSLRIYNRALTEVQVKELYEFEKAN